MKLLIEKTGRTSNALDSIRISKTTISVSKETAERMFNNTKEGWATLGLNDEGNLCLYCSNVKDNRLFKFIHYDSRKSSNLSASISSNADKKAIKPYIGDYEIKYISVNNKQGLKEVILKKL